MKNLLDNEQIDKAERQKMATNIAFADIGWDTPAVSLIIRSSQCRAYSDYLQSFSKNLREYSTSLAERALVHKREMDRILNPEEEQLCLPLNEHR